MVRTRSCYKLQNRGTSNHHSAAAGATVAGVGVSKVHHGRETQPFVHGGREAPFADANVGDDGIRISDQVEPRDISTIQHKQQHHHHHSHHSNHFQQQVNDNQQQHTASNAHPSHKIRHCRRS